MFKSCLLCGCAALMAITVACNNSAPPVADTRDADVAAVKAVEVAWSKDAASKSAEAFVKY